MDDHCDQNPGDSNSRKPVVQVPIVQLGHELCNLERSMVNSGLGRPERLRLMQDAGSRVI